MFDICTFHRQITGINWAPLFEGPLYVAEEDVEPYYEAYTCLAKMLEKSNLKVLYHYLIFTAHEWYHTDCECLLQYFPHDLQCS